MIKKHEYTTEVVFSRGIQMRQLKQAVTFKSRLPMQVALRAGQPQVRSQLTLHALMSLGGEALQHATICGAGF